jgi:hypothetical protein
MPLLFVNPRRGALERANYGRLDAGDTERMPKVTEKSLLPGC